MTKHHQGLCCYEAMMIVLTLQLSDLPNDCWRLVCLMSQPLFIFLGKFMCVLLRIRCGGDPVPPHIYTIHCNIPSHQYNYHYHTLISGRDLQQSCIQLASKKLRGSPSNCICDKIDNIYRLRLRLHAQIICYFHILS